MEIKNYTGKVREWINKYGGALAVTSLPLLAMEYVCLSATGESFLKNLKTSDLAWVLGITTFSHAPIGYFLGLICSENLNNSNLEDKVV